MKYLILTLALLTPTANAGDVVLVNFGIADYFHSHEGRWSGNVKATSTVKWPNWMGYEGSVSFGDVIQSGFMMYRCNPSVEGGCTGVDPDVHRFVFTGPQTPEYPLLGEKVLVNDKIVDGLFERSWAFQSIEDAIQPAGHFPFEEFIALENTEPLFPVGFIAVAHLADIDTIDQMLGGGFGSPLAHRSTQACVPLRIVNGVVFSTKCFD